MIYLVTGQPGNAKTAYVVTTLDKIESSNKVNLAKNYKNHQSNLKLIDKFKDDFGYIINEVGSGDTLKNEIVVLDEGYFDFLDSDDDARPDYYYKRITDYNNIIDRINNRDGDTELKFLLPVRTIYKFGS